MGYEHPQIRGLGNVKNINAAAGQSAEARRYQIAGDAGRAKVTNNHATDHLCWNAGGAAVDCTGSATADGSLAPGETKILVAPDGWLSFLLVTFSDPVVVGTVK